MELTLGDGTSLHKNLMLFYFSWLRTWQTEKLRVGRGGRMGEGTISQGFFSTGLRPGAWLLTSDNGRGLVTGGWARGWGRPSSALSGFSSTWRSGVKRSEIRGPSLLSD